MRTNFAYVLLMAMLIGVPVLIGLHSILLRAGCKLMGVKTPHFGWGCVIGIFAGAAMLLVHFVITMAFTFAGAVMRLRGEVMGQFLGFAQIGIVPFDMFVVAMVYAYLLPTHYAKAILIWFIEFLGTHIVAGAIFVLVVFLTVR